MPEITTTQMGRYTVAQTGASVAAASSGPCNVICTLAGSGAIGFTGALMGSYDNINFTQITAVTCSGTNQASTVVGFNTDYMWFRLDVATITGANALMTGFVLSAWQGSGAGGSSGPSNSASAALTTVAATALVAGLVLKNSACNFYGAGLKAFATAGYLMLIDAAAIPTDGAVTPKRVWDVAANSTIEVGYDTPIRMSVGAVLVFSTTAPFTKTGSATAFMAGECA